jgi:two-component system, NarL family, response regulator NreC
MQRQSRISVVIADDHAILRAGLRMLVNAQPDMVVVAEASDGEQAVQAVRENKPDVAVLDLTMPRSHDLCAIHEIARGFRHTKVLILTMHNDPAYVRATLLAGASGYVLKRSVDGELLAAIRAVDRGGTFVDPSLAGGLVNEALDKKSKTSRPKKLLSDRELQVLRLVARGFSSHQIAQQISVSVKTVETYRARFALKLDLKTRSDVVRFAVQMGLLTPESLEAENGSGCA